MNGRDDHLLNAVENELQEGQDGEDHEERDVTITLEESELWTNFKIKTNEMIVTKGGRRMFPVMKVRVNGLDPHAMYSMLMDFETVDNNRWKYVNGEWAPGGKPEPQVPSCVYIHPESPNFGSHWMKAPVSFAKIKLTNKMNGEGQIMLNSLHKYEPRVHIVRVGKPRQKMVCTEAFPETQFIAVTAYQNEEITALKIKHNPFAKAFLDNKSRNDTKDFTVDTENTQQAGYAQLGNWLIPGPSSLCPSSSHHSQLGAQFGALPSAHGCERYSTMRNHRTAPYGNSYSHRNNSPPSYTENSAACLPVFQSNEHWSGLQMQSHNGMLSLNHTNGSPSNSCQYPGLWPVSNSTIGSITQAGGIANSLGSQYVRSSAHYAPYNQIVPSPSVASPAYESGSPDIEENQYDVTAHDRMAPSWPSGTPPAL